MTRKDLLQKPTFRPPLGFREPGGSACRRCLQYYFAIAEARTGIAACPLHDPLAVGVAIDPGFVRTEAFEADVETDGELTCGMLVADRRKTDAPSGLRGRIQACVEVDADRFVSFFLDRLL